MTKAIGELTAWEEINPVLARRPAPALPCSVIEPASREQFRNELTACLALVAPAGMTEEARRDWLLVAWETLGHLPADLLASGCREARKSCDHPSKLVPAIIEATKQGMAWRKESVRNNVPALPSPTKRSLMDRRGEAMTEADTAELNSILESLGATARYWPDGTRYFVDRQATGANG